MKARPGILIASLSATALLLAARGTALAREGDARPPSRGEPKVSGQEARLLREAAELAKTDRGGAMEKVRAAGGEKSSAALDFALGVFLAQEGLLAEAEEAYGAATKKSPSFVRAWSALGRVRLMRDRPLDAARAFRRAIKEDGPGADLWKLLGYSYLVAGRLLAAESAYRQALVFAPEDREIELGLAKTLLSADRSREAVPLLECLRAEEPLKSEVWMLLANSHLAADAHDDALEVLECAHRLGILGPGARLTLADLYFNRELPEQAARHYDLAFKTGKVSAERMLSCAEALFQVGRTETAKSYLAQARSQGLKRPARGHLLAARIAEAGSDLDAARAAFEAALEADPLNGEALIALGELHWRAGEHDMAEIVLERASRVRGFEARGLVTLARMEVEFERYGKAAEHLEAAQELEPSLRVGRYLEQVRQMAESVRAQSLP